MRKFVLLYSWYVTDNRYRSLEIKIVSHPTQPQVDLELLDSSDRPISHFLRKQVLRPGLGHVSENSGLVQLLVPVIPAL